MRIAVIDGQGGGIGKAIIEKIREEISSGIEIIALGTNALATSLMLKAGADEGASGENAIVYNANKVDIIVGTIGIISANSMLGEITPNMAKAVSESPAKKILIPMNKCNIFIVGIKEDALSNHINEVVRTIKSIINGEGCC